MTTPAESLAATVRTFADRHIGPDSTDVRHMLEATGYS